MSTLSCENDYIKPNGRDSRLDFLRGLFVFIMVVDHISRASPLHYITFGNGFFTSAAEGFFLISGIVSGLVHSKVIQQKGIGASLVKSAHRLLVIYLITIGLSVIVIFLGEHFHLFYSHGISLSQPIQLVQELLVFNLSYFYVDVLIVFCILFFLLPYALILLDSHKTGWLCALSLGVYVFYVIYPASPWLSIKTFMNICGVQLFFIGGLVMGYHRIIDNLQQKINKKWLYLTGSLFLLLIAIWNIFRYSSMFLFLHITDQLTAQVSQFFSKPDVAPGRFIASAIVFSFLYILLTLYWKKINRVIGWLIIPLGENSLFSYSFHVILAMAYLLGAKFLQYDENSYWMNGFLQLTGVLIIWFCIKKKIFTPKPQNRRFYFSLPGIIILLFIAFETIYRTPLIHSILAPLLH